MDAYCNYLRQVAEQRIAELRREADQYRLASSLVAARGRRHSARWSRVRARLRRAARRAASDPLPGPVRIRPSASGTDMKPGMRRSA